MKRFPDDFRFQLTKKNVENLRSQSVTFQWLQGVKYHPYAYSLCPTCAIVRGQEALPKSGNLSPPAKLKTLLCNIPILLYLKSL
ncbi:ORF6N domain-containing protein [Desulfonema ishimotonii]|uniref:ORF6N domain-containing protein n=1 Tax=Desulfonema ishimotonii TaxID=45657 RepID=UPI000F561076|nr:ORF6N domain-containing protein [Desulfonema ishimotonii]